jgi:hypothetical protein
MGSTGKLRYDRVTGDSSVGSVGTSSSLWSSVDLDVAQSKLISLKRLDLGIGFEVGEQVEDNLD